MKNDTKLQIAISLFTGGILAFAVFIGTLAGDLIMKGNKCTGLLITVIFIIIIYLILKYSLQVLFDPSTNYQSFGKIVKKFFRIKKSNTKPQPNNTTETFK